MRADRRAAQSLLDYWSTRLYRERGDDLDGTLAPFDAELAPELPDNACPYLGLAAFHEKDAGVFYGRRELIADLLGALEGSTVLTVVGTSGSGKSSVVFAGLLAAMKKGAYAETQWHYQPGLVPGSDPQAACGRLPDPLPPQSVIVIDQFEEVFTLTPLEKWAPFAGQLLAWADAGHKVILTLRADFEARVNELPEDFGKRLNVVRVLPMSAAELREAVVKPADTVGLKFEAGLVDKLVSEVSGEAAALPLLQFTLWALWKKRQRNRVLMAAYAEVGGGRRALAKAADDFYNALIREKQEAARRILLRMVKINENLEVTSQRIRRADLLSKKDGSEQRREQTLDQLIQERLVRQTVGEMPADTQVEVAHEALVRNWPTLLGWLEEERGTVRQHNRLREQAQRWRENNRDSSYLWVGVELKNAETLEDLTPDEDEFIQASLAEEDRERLEKEAAQQKEVEQLKALAEIGKERTEIAREYAENQARQSKSFRRTAVIGLVQALALLGVMVGFGLVYSDTKWLTDPNASTPPTVVAGMLLATLLFLVAVAMACIIIFRSLRLLPFLRLPGRKQSRTSELEKIRTRQRELDFITTGIPNLRTRLVQILALSVVSLSMQVFGEPVGKILSFVLGIIVIAVMLRLIFIIDRINQLRKNAKLSETEPASA